MQCAILTGIRSGGRSVSACAWIRRARARAETCPRDRFLCEVAPAQLTEVDDTVLARLHRGLGVAAWNADFRCRNRVRGTCMSLRGEASAEIADTCGRHFRRDARAIRAN